MADQPEDLTLRLLREIRAKQDSHSEALAQVNSRFDHVEHQLDDLYKISTHTLGVAANAHVRFEELQAQVNELTRRVSLLETQE
jgi:hypothetical protein